MGQYSVDGSTLSSVLPTGLPPLCLWPSSLAGCLHWRLCLLCPKHSAPQAAESHLQPSRCHQNGQVPVTRSPSESLGHTLVPSPSACPSLEGGKRKQSSRDSAAQEGCLKAKNDPITAGRAVGRPPTSPREETRPPAWAVNSCPTAAWCRVPGVCPAPAWQPL